MPTEAEWEYAARGPEANLYPWGEDEPTCELAQFADCASQEVPVGSLPAGASWVGALDMAGNVWKWVQDWYDSDYYGTSPASNPTGPADGSAKVLRGGSWYVSKQDLRSASRFDYLPDNPVNYSIGFRCAASHGE